jgi:triacylglycerol lipase
MAVKTPAEAARGVNAPDPADGPVSLAYPVVLVHGVFAHDRKGPRFWGRIPRVLAKHGAEVYLGETDAWGGYETNAVQLRAAIDRVLRETRKDKVNIIAHSKGGIDARYLIWKYDYGPRVASLTTIATPHHGAELADAIYRYRAVHWRISKKILKVFGEWYGDARADPYSLNLELTTARMKEFNERVILDPAVYFQSLYTVMNGPLDDMMFSGPYRYIYKTSGENDGVVSAWSASWGGTVRKIAAGVSHAEIIDLKKRTVSGVDIPALYVDIIRDLARRGF